VRTKDLRWAEVSKEHFKKYLENYPNKLVRKVIDNCEPPLTLYDDFAGKRKRPGSTVARIEMHWLNLEGTEADENGHRKFWEYYILLKKEEA